MALASSAGTLSFMAFKAAIEWASWRSKAMARVWGPRSISVKQAVDPLLHAAWLPEVDKLVIGTFIEMCEGVQGAPYEAISAEEWFPTEGLERNAQPKGGFRTLLEDAVQNMNPVPMMGLVELIRGIATEEETFRTVRDVVVKLDKKPVNAEDFPAFIVNRILLPMINEAVYTLHG